MHKKHTFPFLQHSSVIFHHPPLELDQTEHYITLKNCTQKCIHITPDPLLKKTWGKMLFTIIFFLFSLFIVTPPQPTFSLNQEGLLLLEFKSHLSNLSDTSNTLSSWNPTDTTPCHWLGITCDSITAAVTSLNLTTAYLNGPLFAAPLCRLRSLSSLSLTNNSISGTIPNSLSSCRHLRHLDLSVNDLVGHIPSSLSRLTALQHLNLAYNNLTGGVPASFGNLRNLESLILVNNLMDGTIPSSLSTMSSLKVLHLAYNLFEPSQLPSRLGDLASLEEIWLTRCNLVGPIPDSIGNLTRLKKLDLSVNNLIGKIPESFAGLKSVVQIEIYNNSLSGELPLGMGNLTPLELFDASANELTGTIPQSLCELKLRSLNLFDNKLEGPLPASIARSPNLYELKLFNNNLNGTLPSDLGSNSPLQRIDVSFNHFSGEIPAMLCRQGQLDQLIMLNNSFSGKIPESLGNCSTLSRVRLAGNNLSGTVPNEFWALPHVILLELTNNSLSGPISNAISGASSLSQMRISHNRLDGSIPDGIGSLKKLLDFHGSNNKFSGGLPGSMAKLTQLEVLDLSYNELSGEIPGWIHGWTNLSELVLANNKFVGKIPKELGSLSGLTQLDLSINNLSGEIPKELQNLKLNAFNLSYNELTGDVPPFYDNGRYCMSFIGNPGLCVNVSGVCHSSRNSRYRKYGWIFRSVFVLAGIVLIFGLVWFYKRYRNFTKMKKGLNVCKWRLFHKLGFNEHEIVKLMSEDNVIGSGASGKVYKVVLSSGEVVAVKKLWGAPKKGNETAIVGYAKDEFDVEVETLGKIRHKNIVKLLCCCNVGDSRLLVFEYMANGNLADALRSSKKSLLDWPTRYKIAIDTAEGLSYLHHHIVPAIVHRDVKSNNILLDGEFGAKVADFGIAKIVRGASQGTESMSVIAGSYGYIAPEYAYTLRVNEKSDIYSFGVVILELVTGKPPIDVDYGDNDLVKWVSSMLEQNGLDYVIDPALDTKYRDEISKVLSVGLLCTSSLPVNRPAMRKVVKMLQEVRAVTRSRSVKEVTLSPYYYEETSHDPRSVV